MAGAARLGLDAGGARRRSTPRSRRAATRVRGEVRRGARRRPRPIGFLFDLGAFIEGRGWLVAVGLLARPRGWRRRSARWRRRSSPSRHRRATQARAASVRELDAAGLHELRKELKKLRYAVDMLGAALPAARGSRAYLKALKELQDSFGSLNDAAMAGDALTGAGRAGGRRPRGAARRRLGARHAGGAGSADDRPAALRALGPARRRRSRSGAERRALRRSGRAGRPSP